MILIKRTRLKDRDNKVEVLNSDNLLIIESTDEKGVIITIIYVVKKTIWAIIVIF